MTKTDLSYALTTCNVIGLILALLLAKTAWRVRATPDGRARILSSLSVAAFGVAGLAKRINHPYADQIVLGAWVVVLVSQWWKWRDQVALNHARDTH